MTKNIILFIAAVSVLPSTITFAAHRGTHSGRFQLVQLSEFRRDQFLLDSETGRLWRSVCKTQKKGECADTYWQEEEVSGHSWSLIEFKNSVADSAAEKKPWWKVW